jgi:hypothetical protein
MFYSRLPEKRTDSNESSGVILSGHILIKMGFIRGMGIAFV